MFWVWVLESRLEARSWKRLEDRSNRPCCRGVEERGHTITMSGPLKGEAMGWPDVGEKIGMQVSSERADQGIVFCRTGTGVTIAANKVPGIRTALCWDAETAKGARIWDDANVLALSLRSTSTAVAKRFWTHFQTVPLLWN